MVYLPHARSEINVLENSQLPTTCLNVIVVPSNSVIFFLVLLDSVVVVFRPVGTLEFNPVFEGWGPSERRDPWLKPTVRFKRP